MYNFEKIKLIVWDLDETLWEGTLTEGGANIPSENIKLITDLTDIGIVNSICSKNDWQEVKKELDRYGLEKYFVFPSVNWSAKGPRMKSLIADMQLRDANVLFIDDNPGNRADASYFCPRIMTAAPDVIPQLIEEVKLCAKKDPDHKRLKQYQLLEKKHTESTQFASNEDFLMTSAIRLTIENDCLPMSDRIHELILRSNQLNFTKLRCTEAELRELLEDKAVTAGYVTVFDRFGDYGIVGFFALRENRLIHFLFSCRILGMGIEQYVYNYLGRPLLTVEGEVTSDLSGEELPPWINNGYEADKSEQMKINQLSEHTVLIKGPCDLYQIFPFIADTEIFDTEMSFTTDAGLAVESTSHTTAVVEALRLSSEQIDTVVSEVSFTDRAIFSDKIFKNPYKVVIMSILSDANLGVYRRKGTGEKFAAMESRNPLTDPSTWDDYINNKCYCSGFHFTREILKDFSEKYEFIGKNTPEQIVENIRTIRENLPDSCTLVIMLGGELEYKANTSPQYTDRHILHRQINDALRVLSTQIDGIKLVDVNKYLTGQNCFNRHFNHYIKPVYYALAGELIDIVNECTGNQVRQASKATLRFAQVKSKIAPFYRELKKRFK